MLSLSWYCVSIKQQVKIEYKLSLTTLIRKAWEIFKISWAFPIDKLQQKAYNKGTVKERGTERRYFGCVKYGNRRFNRPEINRRK